MRRCITKWPICTKEGNRNCWDESTNQIEIIGEVDATYTDGNTAAIEGQGLSVLSQQRNKKRAG